MSTEKAASRVVLEGYIDSKVKMITMTKYLSAIPSLFRVVESIYFREVSI
jgi:hypothetical protein